MILTLCIALPVVVLLLGGFVGSESPKPTTNFDRHTEIIQAVNSHVRWSIGFEQRKSDLQKQILSRAEQLRRY